jgi:hypothetical protein
MYDLYKHPICQHNPRWSTEAKLKYLDMEKKLIQTLTFIDYFSLSKKAIGKKNFK